MPGPAGVKAASAASAVAVAGDSPADGVSIELLHGGVVTVRGGTVLEAKQEIERRFGTPVTSQRIFWAAKQLRDGERLRAFADRGGVVLVQFSITVESLLRTIKAKIIRFAETYRVMIPRLEETERRIRRKRRRQTAAVAEAVARVAAAEEAKAAYAREQRYPEAASAKEQVGILKRRLKREQERLAARSLLGADRKRVLAEVTAGRRRLDDLIGRALRLCAAFYARAVQESARGAERYEAEASKLEAECGRRVRALAASVASDQRRTEATMRGLVDRERFRAAEEVRKRAAWLSERADGLRGWRWDERLDAYARAFYDGGAAGRHKMRRVCAPMGENLNPRGEWERALNCRLMRAVCRAREEGMAQQAALVDASLRRSRGALARVEEPFARVEELRGPGAGGTQLDARPNPKAAAGHRVVAQLDALVAACADLAQAAKKGAAQAAELLVDGGGLCAAKRQDRARRARAGRGRPGGDATFGHLGRLAGRDSPRGLVTRPRGARRARTRAEARARAERRLLPALQARLTVEREAWAEEEEERERAHAANMEMRHGAGARPGFTPLELAPGLRHLSRRAAEPVRGFGTKWRAMEAERAARRAERTERKCAEALSAHAAAAAAGTMRGRRAGTDAVGDALAAAVLSGSGFDLERDPSVRAGSTLRGGGREDGFAGGDEPASASEGSAVGAIDGAVRDLGLECSDLVRLCARPGPRNAWTS